MCGESRDALATGARSGDCEMAAKCPICSKPVNAEVRPFCSKRCADVDLQRWLVGRYAIPANADDPDVESPADPFGGGREQADGV